MAGTGIQHLPVEILHQILQLLELQNHADLKSTRLTSRLLDRVSSPLLFRSITLSATLHHVTSCPSHKPQPPKHIRSHDGDETTLSFPRRLYPLPRTLRITSTPPDDERSCKSHGCMLDLRACKRLFNSGLFSGLGNLRSLEVDLDYRFLSEAHAGTVSKPLRSVSDASQSLGLKFRNVSVNGNLHVSHMADVPTERLKSLDLLFRDSHDIKDGAGERLHAALGGLLTRASKLEKLRLECWNRLRDGAVNVPHLLRSCDSTLTLKRLEIDGFSAADMCGTDFSKLPLLREVSLAGPGKGTTGFLSALAEAKHCLDGMTLDCILPEFYDYLESVAGTKHTPSVLEVYRTESYRVPDEPMALRFWREGFPLLRQNIKTLRILSCRRDPKPRMNWDSAESVELNRQTTCLKTTVLPSSPSLETICLCVTAGKKFYHAIKGLLSSSEKLRNVELCFHVKGKGQVESILKEFRRTLRTVSRDGMVVSLMFSDPEEDKKVGEDGKESRAVSFCYTDWGQWEEVEEVEQY